MGAQICEETCPLKQINQAFDIPKNLDNLWVAHDLLHHMEVVLQCQGIHHPIAVACHRTVLQSMHCVCYSPTEHITDAWNPHGTLTDAWNPCTQINEQQQNEELPGLIQRTTLTTDLLKSVTSKLIPDTTNGYCVQYPERMP